MNAAVDTDEGVYTIAVDEEAFLDFVPGASLPEPDEPGIKLPLLLTAAAEGSTIVALLDRRPPLAVSHDAGRTWRESGGGLPAGRAIAIAPGEPDRLLFAAATRVYVSTDGGRFWRALALELPEIRGVAWLD
jgi:hypothetical protein